MDTRLRRLPDLVAGLFSDTYAEHFCRRDDWRATPWTRVSTRATGYLPVRRFLDDHREGRIHVSQAEQERFGDILSRAPVLVIRGLPGVGKTVTGLQLASGLREPIRRLYAAIAPADVEGFELVEAASALSFAWRHRSDLRPGLAERFALILPPRQDWRTTRGEIAVLRFILNIACSPLIAQSDAERLAADTTAFLVAKGCGETHTLPLFLLLWNLAALRYERVTAGLFEGVFPDELLRMPFSVLDQRVKRKGRNAEKRAQLSLAGLLALAAPTERKRLARQLEPIENAIP